MQEQLPELPAAAIVGEPCKRDTAPCIGLAALFVSRDDPDATMVVMPADHVIRPAEKFQAAIVEAVSLVEASPGRIVTFGIKPTYPAEIFGYIHRGKAIQESSNGFAPAFVVNSFKEKPFAEAAREFVASGEYYWNSGIFVWQAATIVEALGSSSPRCSPTSNRSSPPGTRRTATPLRPRIHGHQGDFDRLRGDGARGRRRRDRSSL